MYLIHEKSRYYNITYACVYKRRKISNRSSLLQIIKNCEEIIWICVHIIKQIFAHLCNCVFDLRNTPFLSRVSINFINYSFMRMQQWLNGRHLSPCYSRKDVGKKRLREDRRAKSLGKSNRDRRFNGSLLHTHNTRGISFFFHLSLVFVIWYSGNRVWSPLNR